MTNRALWSVLFVTTLLAGPVSLHAQTTNTNCNAYGNQLNCSSTSNAAALQQQQRSQQQLEQGLANLGAAIAQRRANKAAAQQAWSQAAGEQARQAAQIAQANYDAMTEAMQRMLADTSAWSQPIVNNDLNLDWSLLKDVEQRAESREPDTDRRYEAMSRLSYSPTPTGGYVLREDETGGTYIKKQNVWLTRGTLRYDPSAFLFYQTDEAIPLIAEAAAAYSALAIVGDDAFQVVMPPQRGFATTIAPGAIAPAMLGYTIAAISGELPAAFRLWVLNMDGEVVPVEVRVVKEVTAQEPVGPVDGTCTGTTGKKEPRRALQLQVSGGNFSHTRVVLADAPHLKVFDDLKCRIVR